MMRNNMSFWKWFLCGSIGKAGVLRFFDIWLPFHIAIGITLAIVVPVSLSQSANTVLLPLAGIFIGLSFAWGGNVQALLQTDEIETLSEYHPGGFDDYLYIFQSAILAILTTLVVWGLAGFQVFDQTWPTQNRFLTYLLISSVLYCLSSITLRECWHVVLGAQTMLKARYTIRMHRRDKEKNRTDNS